MEDLSQGEIENRIIEAVELLLEHDYHLLEINAHERSISHCLAVHLEKKFNSWYVDCEYNRIDDDVKRLMEVWEGEGPIKPDDTDAKTVYPDIIIHQRRKREENLLVIEMKKTSSSVKDEVDIKKLKNN